MKHVAWIGFLLAGIAFAHEPRALLTYSQTAGNVPPEENVTKECQIYTDHVTIVRDVGGMTARETKQVRVNDAEVLWWVRDAARGHITPSHGPTDSPVITYLGFDNTGPEVMIFKESPDGSRNDSRGAIALKHFLDINCK